MVSINKCKVRHCHPVAMPLIFQFVAITYTTCRVHMLNTELLDDRVTDSGVSYSLDTFLLTVWLLSDRP